MLNRLVRQGIVATAPAGNGIVYGIRPEHLAVPYICGLARLADELFERIEDLLGRWDPSPRFGCLMQRSSGTDLCDAGAQLLVLLVGPNLESAQSRRAWTDRVRDLQQRVQDWTGTRVLVRHTDVAGLVRSWQASDEFIQFARDEGRIIWGEGDFFSLAVMGLLPDDQPGLLPDDQPGLLPEEWQ